MKTIHYGKHSINEDDIEAMLAVLKSEWLTQGPLVEQFEQAVAEYCGAKYAVAVSNGTAALHLACLAAELAQGKCLWTSPNTFVASANCAIYCGALPDFVDIDARTYNLDVTAFAQKLAEAKRNGTLPDVVVPVHFAGQSCEMEVIHALSQKYGFVVIEDACHAFGGTYRQKNIGDCQYSDMTVLSFHPVKTITTGEGGMILTNQEELAQRVRCLRTHGITRDPQLMREESHGAWYYQQIALGFNYRLTDIQAALGISQLRRIDDFVERRRFLAQRYYALLQDLPVTLPWQHPDTASSWHLYVIRLQLDRLTASRRQIFDELRQRGIGVNIHYIPVHTQPYYQQMGFKWGDFPHAEQYYHEAISLPLYYELAETDQDRIITILRDILCSHSV